MTLLSLSRKDSVPAARVAARSADRPVAGTRTPASDAGFQHEDRATLLAATRERGEDRSILLAPARERGANRTGLPDRLKAGVEAMSGLSMDDVRVHRNSTKPAQMQAHGFAQGSDIHLAPGQERHLPHEAWHVVQQKQGRVRATRQMTGGVPVNDDAGLEREADVMGARAAQGIPNGQALSDISRRTAAHAMVQRKIVNDEKVEYPSGEATLKALEAIALRYYAIKGPEHAAKLAQYAYHVFGPAEEETYLVSRVVLLAEPHFVRANEQAQQGDGAAMDESDSDDEDYQDEEKNEDEPHWEYHSDEEDDDHEDREFDIAHQPKSIEAIHGRLSGQVDNYHDWLLNPQVWADRDQNTLSKLPMAIKYLSNAEELLRLAKVKYPLDREYDRQEKLRFEKEHQQMISSDVDRILEYLAAIDDLVKNPPPPPKSWPEFMGNCKSYDYADGVGTAIPITFYKRTTYYEPIVVPANNPSGAKAGRYKFPDGPTIWSKKGTKYVLKTNPNNIFGAGTPLTNQKDQNDRTVQIDINAALKFAGVNIDGKDGDHVRDLGFGGRDRADNYWPLKSEINRRPFLGWRALYGINYIASDKTHRTQPITGLTGKKFVIKDFMPASGGAVPKKGERPDASSGAIRKK